MEPFTSATIQGINFTFERHRCGQWCHHNGIGIGWTNSEKHISTRIGVCPPFITAGGFTVEAWANSPAGQEHIQHILHDRQVEADEKELRDEAGLRPGDSIRREFTSQDNSYSFRVTGLTRAQALRAYKEALDLIAVE